jgi:hypothetical protein
VWLKVLLTLVEFAVAIGFTITVVVVVIIEGVKRRHLSVSSFCLRWFVIVG